jgi:hypothetical protein
MEEGQQSPNWEVLEETLEKGVERQVTNNDDKLEGVTVTAWEEALPTEDNQAT